MPDPQATNPNDAAPAVASASAPSAFADVCQVQRDAEGVALFFGRRGELSPGVQGVALQSRVALGAAGAARLQDLMAALLLGQEPPR